MLPFKHRLPLRISRRAVEEKATTYYSPLFTLLIAVRAQRAAPLPISKPTRFAIIISKKISNKAVTRNLLRRQTLGAIQELLPQIKSGFDVIILTKKSLIDASYSQIKSDLEKILKNAQIL